MNRDAGTRLVAPPLRRGGVRAARAAAHGVARRKRIRCRRSSIPRATRRATSTTALRMARAHAAAGAGRGRRRVVQLVPHHGPVLRRERRAASGFATRTSSGSRSTSRRRTRTRRCSRAGRRSRAIRICSCSTPTAGCCSRRTPALLEAGKDYDPIAFRAFPRSSGRRARRRFRAARAPRRRARARAATGRRRAPRAPRRPPASRRVAEPDREVARPALVADAADRAAREPGVELGFGPREQRDEIGVVESVAHGESGLGRVLREPVPRAARAGSRRSRRRGCRSADAAPRECCPASSIVR